MGEEKSTGRFIYVLGASGVGKDSVIAYARAHLDPACNVIFSHRYVTRPVQLGHENYISLCDAEFDLRKRKGFFQFHWQAHGLFYGVGVEIEIWRRAGIDVVVSGSRAHFATLTDTSNIRPVLIDAPIDILRQRLLARGREGAVAIEERLQRGQAFRPVHPALTVISNEGELAIAGDQFLALLTRKES